MRIVSWVVTYAVALAVATWLLDGIRFTGPTTGQAEIEHKAVPLLVVALVLGLLTSFVKPVLKLLSLPFIVVTLGLFLLVINAAVLLLTGAIAEELGVGFRVDGFWTAVLGSVVVTVVTWLVDGLIGREDD